MCCQISRSEFIAHLAVQTLYVVFCVGSALLWMTVRHAESQDANGDPVFNSDGTIHRYAWSFSESFYFVMMTVSTVGFGDLVPMTPTARWICIIWGTFGIMIFALQSTMLHFLFVGRSDQIYWS